MGKKEVVNITNTHKNEWMEKVFRKFDEDVYRRRIGKPILDASPFDKNFTNRIIHRIEKNEE